MYKTTRLVQINVASGNIYGDLVLPSDRTLLGLCIFAHGSGSSRFSPRNKVISISKINR
jgi:hypothetical protein